VARALCLVDVDAALAVVREGTDDPRMQDSYLGPVAAQFATVDPDRALKLASDITQGYARDRAMASVLSYLPVDRLDEAVQRARSIGNPIPRAMALCRLAQVAPPDRRRELLWRAAQGVLDECLSSSRNGGHVEGAANGLCRISIVARRLGLQDYRELAWRAASVRVRGSGHYVERRLNVIYDFSLAKPMASVDPELARHVVDAAIDCAGGEAKLPRLGAYMEAMAQLDPEGTLRRVETDLADPGTPAGSRLDIVLVLVDVLTKSSEQRERELLTEPEGTWLMETRDAILVPEDWE